MDIASLVLDFIAGYGLLAIFILLVLDGALLLPVFPGEVVLLIAVTAYVHDTASLVFIVLFTTAAGIVGSLLLYAITRGGGRKLVDRFPGFFMMPRKRREKMERTFARPSGQTLVLFLRLFPLTRVLVNIPAGLAKMPIVRFVIMTTIGLLAYHAAFLWFAYEAQRPESPIAAQKEALQASYASPAWDFVEANTIITGVVVLLLAIVLTVRAAAKMHKDPEESTGSLLGWLTTMVLLWGGVALAVATYMDPQAVRELIALGGIDLGLITAELGYGAVPVLFAVAAVAILFGLILARVRGTAKRHKKRVLAMKAIPTERLRPGPRVAPPQTGLRTRQEAAGLAARAHAMRKGGDGRTGEPAGTGDSREGGGEATGGPREGEQDGRAPDFIVRDKPREGRFSWERE